MGCGRVGARLATELDSQGHSVAVIDQLDSAFKRLGRDFGGKTYRGVGFDQDTLLDAGIERAQGFAAVSSGDNSNILAARVARETFAVPRVVARIYDPRRAEVYERLGIPTVATVSWTATNVMRHLLPLGPEQEYVDASGNVALGQMHVGDGWIGHRVDDIAKAAGAQVAYLTRYGSGALTTASTVFQEGDLLHVIYPAGDVEQVAARLADGPARGEENR